VIPPNPSLKSLDAGSRIGRLSKVSAVDAFRRSKPSTYTRRLAQVPRIGLGFRVQRILAALVLGFLLIHFGTEFGVAENDHDQQSLVQLTGVLAQGVEAGCIMLQADDGSLYNLIDVSLDNPPFGSRVLVRGYVEKNVVTTCMQGIPFRALKIQFISVQNSATSNSLTDTSPITSTSASTPTTTSSSIPLPYESIILGIIVGLTAVGMTRRGRMKRS